MRVARRSFLVSTAASLAAPAICRLACAAAPQVTFKLHHFFSSVSSAHDKFLALWARKIAADSDGRIRIDVFPSMQLGGTPAQLFDQVRDGVTELAWIAPSLTPGRFAKTEVFELPFMPSRRALVSSKAIEDFAAAQLKDEFNEVRPVCFSCADRGVIHANRAIRTMEDVKGLSLHVQTRFAGEAMRILGAKPITMPDAQLPVAIAQHVVDGCIDPWHLVPTLRLNDVLKAHTDFSDYSLSTTTLVLVMNKASYDRLPRELKTVIDANSGQAAASMAGAMWDVQAAAVADMVVQRGDAITTLLPDAVSHWRKATEPVVEAWLKDMKARKIDGSKLVAAMRALLAKYVNEPEPQAVQASAPAESESAAQSSPRPQTKADVTVSSKPDVPVAQPAPPVARASPASPSAPSVAAPAAPPPPAKAAAAPPSPVAPPAQPVPIAQPAAPPTVPAPAAPPPAVPLPPASPPVATAAPAPRPVPIPAPPKALDIPL